MSYPIEISEKLKPLIEAMHKGLYYNSSDEELMKVQTLCLERLYAFNATKPNEPKLREQRLRELLAEMGENCYVEPPLHANWGCHTHFGNNVYANFNRGNAYALLADYTAAISCFNKAIEAKPDLGQAYYNRGLAYLQLGNKARGMADLSKAGELGILPSYNIIKRMNR